MEYYKEEYHHGHHIIHTVTRDAAARPSELLPVRTGKVKQKLNRNYGGNVSEF